MTTATATTAFTVTGMTCGGCVRRVREAVSSVEGVTGVEVQFKARRVTVTSTGELDPAAVSAAVSAVGYEATPEEVAR